MGLSAISLFSGAGGLDLAAKWAGIRTVCYVEWDKDCQKNLISRIRTHELDDAPIADDVPAPKNYRKKADIKIEMQKASTWKYKPSLIALNEDYSKNILRDATESVLINDPR